MKPVPFSHHIADTLQLAGKALAADGSKIIAGGQSIGPMLNLRLVRPTSLIGVTRLEELQKIHITGDTLSIGAAVTHASIEDGIVGVDLPPMMRHVARSIAYRAVRNKGTLGGSLAHADPAADWVTTMTALGAKLVIRDSRGKSRREPMAGFMRGAYRTGLRQGECITSVEMPVAMGQAIWGYDKICRKVGEFADAIGAIVIHPDLKYASVVVGATEDAPLLLPDMAREIALTANAPSLAEIDSTLATYLPSASRVKRQLLKTALSRAISKVILS